MTINLKWIFNDVTNHIAFLYFSLSPTLLDLFTYFFLNSQPHQDEAPPPETSKSLNDLLY